MAPHVTVPGQLIHDQFAAFEDDGVTKRSGLTLAGGDFVVVVYKDCSVDPLSVTIQEIGTTGVYCLDWTPDDEGYWLVELRIVFSDDIHCSQSTTVELAVSLPGMSADLIRVLGLLHYNSIVDNQEFNDPNEQLSKWRLRQFDSEGNLPVTDGGNETAGLLHEYEFEAEYSGPNRPKKLRVRKVL